MASVMTILLSALCLGAEAVPPEPVRVQLRDTTGAVHDLSAPRSFLTTDVKAIEFFCDALNCLVLDDKDRGYTLAIPLSNIASGGADDRQQFRLVTRDKAVLSGKLLSGLRTEDEVYKPEQLAGVDPIPAAAVADPAARFRTGWHVAVSLKNERRLELRDCFIVDEFVQDGVTRKAEPLREIAFRSGSLQFVVPLKLIGGWKRAAKGPPGEVEVEFPPGSIRASTLLTRTMDFVVVSRPPIFGPADGADYLAGRVGDAFYLVPLQEITACASGQKLPEWAPTGPRMVLTDRTTRQETAVTNLQPRVFVQEQAEDAILATLTDVVVRTGDLGYVGVPLAAVQQIEPGEAGRVVLQTRHGSVIAGSLVSTLQGEVAGATVELPPAVFAEHDGQFLGNWEAAPPRRVGPTQLDVELVLRDGLRRNLADAFLVDRVGQGLSTKMMTGIQFPVCKDGLRYRIDLRRVKKIDRLEDDRWQVDLRSNESLVGTSAFAQPERTDAWGTPDALDFAGGSSSDSLLLVPLKAVASLRVELKPGAILAPPRGFPLSEAVVKPAMGEKVRVSNLAFTPPPRVPIAETLAGNAPAVYCQHGDVTRVLHLRAVARLEPAASGAWRILGKFEPFEARLVGAVRADVLWGDLEMRPQDLAGIDVVSVVAGRDLSPVRVPPRPIRVETRGGQTVSWDFAWVADLHVSNGKLAIRYPDAVRVETDQDTRDIPFNRIDRVAFDALAAGGVVSCQITQHGSSASDAARLRLLSVLNEGQEDFGPVTHDCVVGLHAPECLEVVPFHRISVIHFPPAKE